MDIQKLINDYTQWLKSEITFAKIGEYYEITTPYLDNANDYLDVYKRQPHIHLEREYQSIQFEICCILTSPILPEQ